jgi:hypothetical protein
MDNSTEASFSCKNVISLFEKLGGKFTCNYDESTCKLNNADVSITTQIKETDRPYINKMVWNHGSPDVMKDIENVSNKKIKKIHDYQFGNSIGFTIDGKKDIYGMWSFVR